MKVLIRQFLGKNHSWSVVGWHLARSLKQQGNDVDLFSTDGIKHLPTDLKSNLIGYHNENDMMNINGRYPDKNYDAQISYTAMKNFPLHLSHGTKNRVGIWCYEWSGKNVMPTGFAKYYKSCDILCPPSNFAKQVFLDSGIPESVMKIVPHGIEIEKYKQTSTIELPTKKKFKILANIAQNHLRKNIPGLLESYGKAFTNKDDVCLILKAKDKPVAAQFEISLSNCIKDFNDKFPKHAEIKILSEFIEDMSSLYRSIDAVFTMTHSECFYFPGLEGLASGKLSIAPNWGGQIDFLNDNNALLITGSEVKADPKSMYWESKNNAIWFKPSVDDAVDKLRFAYSNFEDLNKKIETQREYIYNNYSWESISKQYV